MATQVVLTVVILQIFSLYGRIYGSLDDLGIIINDAIELDGRYETLLSGASGYSSLVDNYIRRKGRMQLERVDGLNAAKTMATQIGQMLQKKVDALNESVYFAEQLALEHTWDDSLELCPNYTKPDADKKIGCWRDMENIELTDNWINAKKVNDSEEGYVYSEKFKARVNYQNSSVHIPVEIYEGDIDILNGLSWTTRLEEQWQKNLDKDNSLIWQYFGSQTGIFRKYPASKWLGKGVDLYDVRRRPWYTQGASSPKDMLILVDTSGSTHGQALTLMKQAVRSLIDTLGENDYVNIARFSDDTGIVGCFKTFVQANYINKGILFNSIDSMEAKGMASYSLGLEYAFKQFEEFDAKAREGEGANCNRVIMFLTDGGTEMPEDIIRKHNWPKKKIRIFGYAVGPTANPVAAVKWIACSNKGYFARIPAMGAIRSTVQGLGMMTTVTLPVYNRTEDITNQTILGVMGSDVTVDEMLAFTPTKMLGASGYVFAINANGYVMFHPNLKAQMGFLDDPPNIDFLDVEQDTEDLRELRKDMIDGKEGSRTITAWSIANDETHLDNITKTYYFTKIPGTNFSLAVVVLGEQSYYLADADATNGTSDNGTSERYLSSDYTAIMLAPWNFCNDVVQIHNNSASTEDMIYQIRNDYSNCDEKLINHLLFDALVTSTVEDVWKSISSVGIDARFLATAGGLTRVYPSSANVSFLNYLDPHKSLYYQRAVSASKWIYMADFHRGISDPNATEPVITAVKSITLSGVEKFKPAVAGARVEQSYLRDKLLGTVTMCSRTGVVCYLMDGGGYIMLSADEEDRFRVGQFLGDVDLVLMRHLVNSSIYKLNEKFDYQASCPIEKPIVSAGIRSVFVPAVMDMLTVNWWSTKFAWMYLQFNIYDWIFSPFHAEAASVTGGEDAPLGNRSCIKLMTQYNLNEEVARRGFKGDAICGNCTREFAAARLLNSNLLLVAVEADCDGVCDPPTLNSQPVEKNLFEDHPETCQVEARYRVRPAECYDYDERENDSDCGGGSTLLPSVLLLVVQTLGLLVLVRGGLSC